MSIYSTERSLDGPFQTSVPVQKLTEFYRANGYELAEVTGRPPDEDDPQDESGRAALYERGESKSRWWYSDMSRLPTRVEVLHEEEGLRVKYEVETSGHHLTDAHRSFWERELQAAGNYLRNPSRRPRDLRHEEAKHAEQVRRRLLSYCIWVAIVIFVIVVFAKFMTSL